MSIEKIISKVALSCKLVRVCVLSLVSFQDAGDSSLLLKIINSHSQLGYGPLPGLIV